MSNLKLLPWLAVLLLPVAAAQAAESYDEGGSDEERFSLRLMGGFALESHSTTSADASRFSASLPSSSGYVAGGEFRFHKRESTSSWRLRYRHNETQYANLGSAVTPSSVTDKRDEFHLAYYATPFDSKFFQHLKLGIGLFALARNAQETKVNSVLTASLATGFSLNASYGRRINDDLNWEANASVSLPVTFREFYQRTGYYANAMIFRANFSFAYTISRFVDLAIVPEIRWDRFSFEDSGSRGTQGAVDGGLSLMAPFEIRVRF